MANLRTNNLSGEQGQNAYRGSLYFNGIESADFLTLASSSDFDFSTGDVTVEAWVFMSSHPSHSHIFSTSNFDLKVSSGSIRLFTTSGETDTSRTVSTGSWHHIAAVRGASINSGNWVVYLNGIGVNYSLGSVTSGDSVAEVSGRVRTDDEEFHGFISNLRVVNGTAVYTSDFTPPTSELTLIPNTVLLCCQDSDDPTQEATGKTITTFGSLQRADGVELITNGHFSTATTGWTAVGGATLSVSSGQLVITGDGSAGGGATQSFTTVIGKTYVLKYDVANGTISAGQIRIGTSSNGYEVTYDNSVSEASNKDIVFTATDTTTYVTLGLNAGILTSGSFKYDNVSVTLIDHSGKSYGSPKFTPPVGRDAGNAFGGTIQQSTQGYMYFPTGRTEERVTINNNFGTRGLVFQGFTYPSAPSSTRLNTIEFITVATKGNATDFGDLISKADSGAGAGNLTRGIQVAGNDPSGATNVIQFVTIATTGDATDFGDVGYERCNSGAVSNQTRLVYSGGEGMSSPYPKLNNIEFITFATTGNGTDFGDQVTLVNSPYGVSSPTRGVFMGGSGATPVIQKIEISTTGNSVLFGDLTSALYNVRGTITNGHRGVIAGGVISPTGRVNNIEYITIQTGGQSIDFGDLTDARDPSNLSSMTRGVMLSGDYPANVNIMDFIEIMTTGNAVDFGDCNKSSASSTASNGHGGLADAM